MDIERENLRLRMVSDLLTPFVGPLQQDHCHICLDSWYSTSSSSGENDITCKEPVIVKNCQCTNIVIGRSCITSWLLDKDTCPMCRTDLIPHIRSHPPLLIDGEADNEDASIPADYIDEEYEDDNLEDQSWLSDGNYLHATTITTGEHISVSDLVKLFLGKAKIETLKTEAEKTEWYSSLGTHSAEVWEKAYLELVQERPQTIEDLYTVHGPVCIAVESW